ncbi:hypothetical protein CEXT_524371 [Caerostris extrusa]|uniref:Uncharacterized protein n=1 Tax=Caerostris extrusa TaxID=172846 RepID=A0AAV4XMA5_CAEEX|nr:hypothetical protein CEXT_524371 [Caerostris extrusa]
MSKPFAQQQNKGYKKRFHSSNRISSADYVRNYKRGKHVLPRARRGVPCQKVVSALCHHLGMLPLRTARIVCLGRGIAPRAHSTIGDILLLTPLFQLFMPPRPTH